MAQGEESSWWVTSDHGRALPFSQALACGIQSHAPAARPANFLELQPSATAYFAAGYLAARPPTLEIFPSWPMSHLQQPYSGNSHSVGSTSESSSGQNAMPQAELVSPGSMRADSGQQQEVLMVTVDDYNYEQGLGVAATTAPIFQQHTESQDKRKQGSTRKDGKLLDAKTERRLAQNREAARKSRLRKKAYVQQLETSRIRLQQIEQELQGARSQGLFPGGGSASGDMNSGALMFDMEYARWLEDDSKHMTQLQGILQAQNIDANLGTIVEECMRHYDELFHLRAMLARSDVFHLMTGLWATTAERCFLWMGGFRPSEILKMLIPQLDPLTEQQLLGMCNLQRSSEQTEEALVQGLQQLHKSLADAVGASPLSDGANVANYTALMALALDRLDTLESFYRQADNLRQQTLHHMRRLLTTRQTARCFLSIGEYHRRLRALSSVWASRPLESFVAAAENVSPTGTAEQAIHHPYHQSQFSGF
ncbi:transcription factor TGAL5 isoform X3 [Setaria italica]|uniref:transcription factor TGAL5 isoform X3 n=1 Tax=Setaria italica TaxID=4555 RepID=UPI00064912B6|nr:transcription factor TGAL5 isoform X3 [Setaria italica]XP_034588834.1 transcription factor TGAL5-like isoform X3 [Setaria viridis]